MKKILILLITLFILAGCTAQQQPIQADNNIDDQQEVVTNQQPVIPLEGEEGTPVEEMIVKQDTTEENTKELTVKEFNMEAYLFGFEPSTIEVNEGDTVRITIKSRDVEHGIGIPEFKVNKKIGKEPVTVEFVADKKGSYPFICSVFCGEGHKEMKGMLIVK